MAPDVAEVERALLALAPAERAAVIHRGLLSLDGAEPTDVDGAWRAEIGARLDDVLQSRVDMGSFEETRARFVAKYPVAAR